MKIVFLLSALLAVTLGNEITTNDDDALELGFPTPSLVHAIKPELRVFGRGGKQVTITHLENPASVLGARGFLNARKLVFIVLGFLNTGDEKWVQDMRDALINAEDQTVAIVAWGGGANLGLLKYNQAASNTRTIGSWLGDCAKKIKEKKSNIYLHGIGHSLGAHVLGMAGRASGQFDRISGLDPAGPNFEPGSKGYEDGLRGLSQADAKTLVDVIHTDCYTSLPVTIGPSHYGMFAPMGTVDFYPNYGYEQPGTQLKIHVGGSHARAHEFFTWSISNKGKLTTNQLLVAAPTKSNRKPAHQARGPAVEMGYHADAYIAKPTGLYYVKITAKKAPWI